MDKLLHIIATPRGDNSRTLMVSQAFLEGLEEKCPDYIVSSLDLTIKELPRLSADRLKAKYTLMMGRELVGEEKDNWQEIRDYIERFKSANAYLISVPMWNFSIPYYLKQYIDIIVQPRYTFRFSERGNEGLVLNRRMVIVTSRGGDYSQEGPLHSLDHQEEYLKAIFGFIGIKNIKFIHLQPTDSMGPKVQRERLEAAVEKARQMGREFYRGNDSVKSS